MYLSKPTLLCGLTFNCVKSQMKYIPLSASGAPLFRGLYPVAAGTAPAARAVPSQPSGFLVCQPSKLGTQEFQTWAHATCNRRSRSSPGHVSVMRTRGLCPGLVHPQPSSGFTRRRETVTEPGGGPGTGRLTRPATPSRGKLNVASTGEGAWFHDKPARNVPINPDRRT